jgi:hypothetical protein
MGWRRRTAWLITSVALGTGFLAMLYFGGRAVIDRLNTNPSEATATPAPGDRATWALEPSETLATTMTSFTALVTRVGCNGGETGLVYEPGIAFTPDEVVVTFTVEPGPLAATCPSNLPVPYDVELGQELGNRRLVDGACRPGDKGAEPIGECTEVIRAPASG